MKKNGMLIFAVLAAVTGFLASCGSPSGNNPVDPDNPVSVSLLTPSATIGLDAVLMLRGSW